MSSALNKAKAAKTEHACNAGQQVLVLRAANRVAHLLSKAQRVEEAIEELMDEFLNLVEAEEGSIQLLRPGSAGFFLSYHHLLDAVHFIGHHSICYFSADGEHAGNSGCAGESGGEFEI